MQQLFDLIVHVVYDEVVQLSPTDPVWQETRLLQSTGAFDYVPMGSDNCMVKGKWDTEWASKGSEPSQASLDKAGSQLVWYILNLYTSQPNCWFAWALITFVYVCLFGHDHVYHTQAINLATLAGHQLFAQFIICWSLAGPVQFGLDPMIMFNVTMQEWAIACFDNTCTDEPPVQMVYYAKHSIMSIHPLLFGHHTMLFFASAEPNGNVTVFIKDTWPIANVDTAEDDLRNEIMLLHHIHEQFSMHDPGVPYLQIKMGSTIQQHNHDQLEKDDATMAYGSVKAALPLWDPELPTQVHCVHWRMVMTPIAD
ncbi:hypothetical protein H4R34_001567 [Dimargaris verticillata]|uniref:Uncharacterized protein n=1 Tax=Dimargaris verticillata TaxID=2761393 RepID=A0A9W8EDN5_9FUNG|nr:hypothetical protein H4R34_001567 [Dimargaris verticillata]